MELSRAITFLQDKEYFVDNLSNQNLFNIKSDVINFANGANGLEIAVVDDTAWKQLIAYTGNVIGKELRITLKTGADIKNVIIGFCQNDTGYASTKIGALALKIYNTNRTYFSVRTASALAMVTSAITNDPLYTEVDLYFRLIVKNTSIVGEVYSDATYTTLIGSSREITGLDESFTSALKYMFIYIQDGSATGLQIKRLEMKDYVIKELTDTMISVASLSSDAKTYSDYGKLSGSQVHIYQFGGEGNNWCWVRTPASYDPQREKPYPFVICCHGNGWTMNGTEAFANWTDHTQFGVDAAYLDTGVPYYKQYSNETIERLLEAGYVVCGSEDYASGSYGNTNCRTACADFYYHMFKNYNVEEKCNLIGASNGGLTALNAMYILGGVAKVKSIILQYPLTCLWKHYSNYAPHQADIETAYGIASGLTEAQFEKATRTHDPEKVCTIVNINGVARVKTMAIPPIKFWYSLGDTTTPADHNSIPLIQVLEDSNCYYDSVVATGQHGDASHFDPVLFLAWFNIW